VRKIGQNSIRRPGAQQAGIEVRRHSLRYHDRVLSPESLQELHGLDALALEVSELRDDDYAEVTGTGKKQIGFSDVDIATATRYSGEKTRMSRSVEIDPGSRKLREQGLDNLFHNVEMKLMSVLGGHGVCRGQGRRRALEGHVGRLEARTPPASSRISTARGIGVQHQSPKQLADILFVKLGLTRSKDKNGFFTDVERPGKNLPRPSLPAEI